MKLFVILAAVACCNAAKLDKTYLPPSHSPTSGGSGNFLQTPFSRSGGQGLNGQNNGFAGNTNGFAQNSNGFEQSGNGFAQNSNGFAQNSNGFTQNGNGLGQNVNGFGQNSNDFSQGSNDYYDQGSDSFTQNSNGFAQNNNGFAQSGNEYSQNGNGFGNFEARPERAQAAFERNAAILRQDNQNDGETFSYAFETENGIYAEENGVATNGVEAQGGYSYTGDDGQVYSIRYTADQNGFVPQGEHLPTPPPVPEEIQKALEQNARDEAAGIYDDGSYSEGKYSNSDEQFIGNNNFANNNNFNYGNTDNFNNENAYNNQNQFEGDDDSVVTDNASLRNSGNGFNNAQGFNNGVEQIGFNRANSNQGTFNGGISNQGSFNGGISNQGATKAYLPPFATQRNSNAGFGSRTRQPSFSARNGYRY